jgi:uncharacterized repeat protein (TIGR03803 family)
MLAEGHGLILPGFNTDSCYRHRPPSPVQFLSIPHGQQPTGLDGTRVDSNCKNLTVFKVTPSGTLTTLHGFARSFDSENYCEDGNLPTTGLIQATNGILYGTTSNGGAADDGTIFQITPSGKFTTLYDFQTTTGGEPNELMQATDGTLYGTTQYGGANQSGEAGGTVFSLSVGLGPFVATQTASGNVGTTVEILGTNLAGATSVTFNARRRRSRSTQLGPRSQPPSPLVQPPARSR